MFPKIHSNHAFFWTKAFSQPIIPECSFSYFLFRAVFPGFAGVSNEPLTKGKVLLTPLETIKGEEKEKETR